ncbi:MAG: translation initiation factor IF-2 [Candidatus Omnitrophica bacterium]|nr:translation initiation factor IF-2 [Candidatus Omnitrophota bacterium]
MVIKPKKEKKAIKKEVTTKNKQVVKKPAKTVVVKQVKKTLSVIKHKTVETAKVKKLVVHKKPAVKKEEVSVSRPIVAEVKPIVHPAVPIHVKVQSQIHAKPQQPAAAKPILSPKPAQPVKPETKVEVKSEVKAPPVPAVHLKDLELELPITVKDLAIKLQEKPSVIIKSLMDLKIMVGINQNLDEAVASKICEKYHFKIKKALDEEETALSMHNIIDEAKDLKHRSPVITFMGHVDHGKTSLLDAIRKTKVAEGEHGGITQHIGAYRVELPHGEITFLDTPGHEAFTAMRSRGASITDIVVLVVAADDGIMPQTQEAIDHARAAGVSLIVAINKIDMPGADVDKVKKQLAKLDLNPEDWGGKTITVPVSAKTGQGIDDLLEMIILEAQMLELKANPNRLAKGVVIEAQMSKGRGPVVTLLVQNGTLHLNENIIVGNYYGKIRAMFNDRGHSVTFATPSVPVEVLGITDIPAAGEQFFAFAGERQAKDLAQMRLQREKQQQIKVVKRINLEDLHAQIQEGKIKELKLVIKADVQGSIEAIKDTLNKLNVSEIKLDFIHAGVGDINSSDVILAIASNALILGFNVRIDDLAKELMDKEGVDVKVYNIIYELANDIKAAIEGMLEPKLKKIFLGRAEVRKVLRLSKAGTIAGCFVNKGKFNRNCTVNLIRNGELVFEGKLSSLKRFKDDVREVAEGFECGMSFSGFDQYMEGDIIEAYDIEKIARRL